MEFKTLRPLQGRGSRGGEKLHQATVAKLRGKYREKLGTKNGWRMTATLGFCGLKLGIAPMVWRGAIRIAFGGCVKMIPQSLIAMGSLRQHE